MEDVLREIYNAFYSRSGCYLTASDVDLLVSKYIVQKQVESKYFCECGLPTPKVFIESCSNCLVGGKDDYGLEPTL